MKGKILITGASGYVGGRLLNHLYNRGYKVRCLARNPDKIIAKGLKSVEVFQGDLLEPATLLKPLQGVETVYYFVHSMGSKGDFEDLDIQAARNFGYAAAQAKAARIIYLGGLAKDPAGLSPHLQSRQRVGKILGESGVPVTELRASIIIGSGSASFEIIRDLVKKLPVMVTPRWVKSLCEPIAIDNVIEYLYGCLNDSRTIGEVLEIGGGEVLTYENMMRQVAEVIDRKLLILPVPVLTPRLSAYWLNIVTTIPASIAYPLVDGLRNDSITTDKRIRKLIPLKLISFKEAVGLALHSESENKIETRWTEASFKFSKANHLKKYKKLTDEQIIITNKNPEEIFDRICRIGGDTGWYYANWAWKIRGAIDRLMGGVGMRRGRRHPSNIRVGDAIDFWRVTAYKPTKYLELEAEMKLPGRANLRFEVREKNKKQTYFQQKATFKPSNVFGVLYWNLMLPVHLLIFKNMAKRIVFGFFTDRNTDLKTADNS